MESFTSQCKGFASELQPTCCKSSIFTVSTNGNYFTTNCHQPSEGTCNRSVTTGITQWVVHRRLWLSFILNECLVVSGHKPQLQVSKNHENNESRFISGLTITLFSGCSDFVYYKTQTWSDGCIKGNDESSHIHKNIYLKH